MFIFKVKRIEKKITFSVDLKELLFAVVAVLCILRCFGYI